MISILVEIIFEENGLKVIEHIPREQTASGNSTS